MSNQERKGKRQRAEGKSGKSEQEGRQAESFWPASSPSCLLPSASPFFRLAFCPLPFALSLLPSVFCPLPFASCLMHDRPLPWPRRFPFRCLLPSACVRGRGGSQWA
ncbi:MAG: hypothetical protein FJ291_10575 [Planctomycetes bacterium]|nr:hypothetical protein [Planctomycetota bacterium]